MSLYTYTYKSVFEQGLYHNCGAPTPTVGINKILDVSFENI